MKFYGRKILNTQKKFFITQKLMQFMLLKKYSDDNFCEYPIAFLPTEFFSQRYISSLSNKFSLSKEFTLSNQFSLSKEFTLNNQFSLIDQLSPSNIFSLRDQFSTNQIFSFSKFYSSSESYSNKEITQIQYKKYTFSLTFSVSFKLMKSVSFSFFFSIKNKLTISYDSSNQKFIFSTCEYSQYYLPYIIHFFSPTFISSYILFPINTKQITKEQLIGKVCGYTSIFFIILYIIIFIYQKKHFLRENSEIFIIIN